MADTSSTPASSDIIKELIALDDASLATKLGFTDKTKSFREDIARADKLTGKGRDMVVDKLKDMFAPQSYSIDSIGYTVDRAAKSGDKTTPQSIVDCCCGDGD